MAKKKNKRKEGGFVDKSKAEVIVHEMRQLFTAETLHLNKFSCHRRRRSQKKKEKKLKTKA